MYQAQEQDQSFQEPAEILDNQPYLNVQWLHNQNLQSDISSPKQEPIWPQHQQNIFTNVEPEYSYKENQFGFQEPTNHNQSDWEFQQQSKQNQNNYSACQEQTIQNQSNWEVQKQPEQIQSYDPQFRPNPLCHHHGQSNFLQDQYVILPPLTSMETQDFITFLGDNYQPDYQLHQGIVPSDPEQKQPITKKVVKQTKAARVTKKTNKVHPSEANTTKIIKTMVSQTTQTFEPATMTHVTMVSNSTQTITPTVKDVVPKFKCDKIKKLYSALKRLDAKVPSKFATKDHALRMAQARQNVLQSLNVQVANMNKTEATAIFALYSKPPFPALPTNMASQMN